LFEAMLRRVVTGVVGLILTAGVASPTDEAPAPFKVILNPSVAGRTVPREVLAQVYLGAVVRWGDGSPIAAVDLSSTSPVRQAFSEQVLGLSLDAVKVHWLRRIAGGQRPPLSKSSDAEVIAFVAGQRGGVGYVSATTPVPPSVHEVVVN
jgi:ABC-type phosphate transport system substrate-binding protein